MQTLEGLERRLTLRQLRAICSISESGRLLAAATTLGVSQPALTRMVHELETLFGVRLFERSSRGVTPTAYGTALTAAARNVLREIAQLEHTINGLMLRKTGGVAIGALPSAAAGLMSGTISRIEKTHPRLEIRLVQGRLDELLPVLRGGGIEMLVGRLYPSEAEDGLVRRVLYDEPLALLARAGHPLARAGLDPRERLADYRLLLPTFSQRLAAEADAWLAQLISGPVHALRTSSPPLMREMVLANDDVLLLPSLMMAGDIIRGTLIRLAAPVAAPARPGGVFYRHGVPLSEPAQFWLKALRSQIRALAAAGIVSIS